MAAPTPSPMLRPETVEKAAVCRAQGVTTRGGPTHLQPEQCFPPAVSYTHLTLPTIA